MKKKSRNLTAKSGFKKRESFSEADSQKIDPTQVKRDSSTESLLFSEHIVRVEKLIVGGEGLARIQHAERSFVVFIARTAPQDLVRIKITHVEKNHAYAEVIDVIETSPHRESATCEYYKTCGGCNWQHVKAAEQIRQKEMILLDLMKKFNPELSFELLKTVTSEKSFHYRNRIQLKHLGTQLGYFRRGSHEIVDIEHCPLAEEALNQGMKDFKKKLRPSTTLNKYELRLTSDLTFEAYPIGEDGEGLSFSQVNRFINEKLVGSVQEILAQIKPHFLTELYAGAGNFTFAAMDTLPELRIEAAELNSKLTTFAVKKMTEQKRQKNLNFFTTDCESFVARRELSTETVLLDPPRAGCSDPVVQSLIKFSPQNIIYVSCHPVNLMRDLQKINQARPKLYNIKHLQIFDMFPQTDHFETLIWLQKSES